jgi:hypothetical protein
VKAVASARVSRLQTQTGLFRRVLMHFASQQVIWHISDTQVWYRAGELKAANTFNVPENMPLAVAFSALAYCHSVDPAVSKAANAVMPQVRSRPCCNMFGSQMGNTLDQATDQMAHNVDKPHLVIISSYTETIIITNLPSIVMKRLQNEPPSGELAAVMRSHQGSIQLYVNGPYSLSHPGTPQKRMRVVSLLGRKDHLQRQMYPDIAAS